MPPQTTVTTPEIAKNTEFADELSRLSGQLSPGESSGIKSDHMAALKKKIKTAKTKYTKLENIARKASYAVKDIQDGDAQDGQAISDIPEVPQYT